MRDTSFRGADLRGADFKDEGRWVGVGTLPLAEWTGAVYDQTTRWPARFDPRKHGCILVGPEPDLPRPASASEADSTALPLPASPERSGQAAPAVRINRPQ